MYKLNSVRCKFYIMMYFISYWNSSYKVNDERVGNPIIVYKVKVYTVFDVKETVIKM